MGKGRNDSEKEFLRYKLNRITIQKYRLFLDRKNILSIKLKKRKFYIIVEFP
jgi:hypothetical protein